MRLAQYSATSLTPQPHRSFAPQSPEQLRIRHRPGVTARALKLRLTTFFHVGRTRRARRQVRHLSGVASHQLSRCGVLCLHRVFSLSGGKRACHATALGHWQTHHVGEPSHLRGGPGLPCRSCARFLLEAAGGRAQPAWDLRARALILISASLFLWICRCPPAFAPLATHLVARFGPVAGWRSARSSVACHRALAVPQRPRCCCPCWCTASFCGSVPRRSGPQGY